VSADEDGGGPPDLAPPSPTWRPTPQVYVCGPIPMLEAAKRAWAAAGRAATNLRFETFGSSGRYANAPFTVRIPRLGLEIEVPKPARCSTPSTEAGVGVLADCRRGRVRSLRHGRDRRGRGRRSPRRLSQRRPAPGGDKICACVSRLAGGAITVEPAWRGDISTTPSKVFG
jgi:hypothetical protein